MWPVCGPHAFIRREHTTTTRSHLGDEEEAEEEADNAETEQQQFPTVSSPKHVGEHVCHGGHQAFQTNKLPGDTERGVN